MKALLAIWHATTNSHHSLDCHTDYTLFEISSVLRSFRHCSIRVRERMPVFLYTALWEFFLFLLQSFICKLLVSFFQVYMGQQGHSLTGNMPASSRLLSSECSMHQTASNNTANFPNRRLEGVKTTNFIGCRHKELRHDFLHCCYPVVAG